MSAAEAPSFVERACARLDVRVDGASLAVFRALFGAVIVWEAGRYFAYGWIAKYYIEPSFHFTYFGFEWVRPLSAEGMYAVFVALALAACGVAVGFRYRWSALIVWALLAYIFFLEQARYLNHFYLLVIVGFLMFLVPAQATLSVDAKRAGAATVPVWSIFALRAQVAIAYVYGGVAKLDGDWLLRGEPLRTWLGERADLPIVGPLLETAPAPYFFAWCGLLLDLFIVPLVLWPRTRALAIALLIGFHGANAVLFEIGVFPWFMLAATTLFLSPDWPRRALARLGRELPAPPDPAPASARTPRALLALLALHFAVQLALPLRHHLYPSDVRWTEEGHRFSWRMKLRDKSGSITFLVTADGDRFEVNPRDFLPKWQRKKVAGQPELILQLAHHIAAKYRQNGYRSVEVHARALASVNGRPEQLLVDPDADLARVERGLGIATWILPLASNADDEEDDDAGDALDHLAPRPRPAGAGRDRADDADVD